MKNLFFNVTDWHVDKQVPQSVATIKTVRGFDGAEVLTWQLGDWNWNWTTLTSKRDLEPNTEYIFTFWLNGGENDRGDEVCNLEIFGDDWDLRTTFKLNRDYILPTLIKNGWYLFCIPFKTDKVGKTTLRFSVSGAITTIAPAQSAVSYENLESDDDDHEKPQRSNVVFENGWPDDITKKTSVIKEKLLNNKKRIVKALKVVGVIVAGILVLKKIFKKKKGK